MESSYERDYHYGFYLGILGIVLAYRFAARQEKMKRIPADNDEVAYAYSVHSCEYGHWIVGRMCPTSESSALMKQWDWEGYHWMSAEVARLLGKDVQVAVTKTVEDAKLWLESLRQPLTGVDTPPIVEVPT